MQRSLDRGFKHTAWARPESMHLTLKFIGEIDDRLAVEAASRLAAAAAGVAPFTLSVEGVGGFPNQRAPRVVWAGIAGSGALDALKGRVEDALSSVGIPREERPYSPHLTLCRARTREDSMGLGRLISEVRPGIKAAFEVRSFVFFKSVLRPGGAEHLPISEFALKA